MGNIRHFIFQIIGAFIVWAFKGFKGKLDDEIGSPNGDIWKLRRNFIISIIILILIGNLFNNNNRTSEKENYYDFIKAK